MAEDAIEKATHEGATKLVLSYCKLHTIPSLASLGNLTVLWVGYNYLTELPSSLASLTALKELYLNVNHLRVIPSSLAALTGLKELNLNDNELESLPSLNSLTALKILCLSNNRLQTLPPLEKLTALKWLDVEDNQLHSILSLSGLTRLREIALGGNPIERCSLQSVDHPSVRRAFTMVGAYPTYTTEDYGRLRSIIPLHHLAGTYFEVIPRDIYDIVVDYLLPVIEVMRKCCGVFLSVVERVKFCKKKL